MRHMNLARRADYLIQRRPEDVTWHDMSAPEFIGSGPMVANITALISAGLVLADDNRFMLLQGLDDDTANALADWLAVVTGGPVCLRHMNLARRADYLIQRRPEDVTWHDMSGLQKRFRQGRAIVMRTEVH